MGNGQNIAAPPAPQHAPHPYFPVFLDLRGKPCLVLGAGEAARSKAAALAEFGAVVVQQQTDWKPGDLDGYFLCIAAGLSRAQNAVIFEEACRRGVLFNALDDPEHCHFIQPAIHRQGGLIIAVSTSGACPALAVRIRDRLAGQYGAEYAEFVSLCSLIRSRLARLFPDFETRRAAWYALVDSEVLDRIRAGQALAPEDLLEELCKTFGLAPRI